MGNTRPHPLLGFCFVLFQALTLASTPLLALPEAVPREQADAEAARAQALAEACARTACRAEAKEITLNAPGDRIARFRTEKIPYADGGSIAIYPGESFAVRIRVQGEQLGEPVFEQIFDGPSPAKLLGHHPDAEAKALQDTKNMPVEALLYLYFKQDDKGPGMTLEITSALPVTVKYDAVMFAATPDGIRPAPTSSCPVASGIAALETWPQPLTMLLLSNFRVVDTARGFTCQ
jgi:hypothetical protein